MALGSQLGRLARHSAIYGLGGLVSRILAVLLLPLYTSYLLPSDYGKIETLVAGTTVLTIVLRAGISSAFFRFYFDSPEPEKRRTVLRTSFWFTITVSTAGLVALLLLAGPIATALFGDAGATDLVRAAGDAPVTAGPVRVANLELLRRAAAVARRVEAVAVEPRYDIRPRPSRVRLWPDLKAILRAGWAARKRRVPATA